MENYSPEKAPSQTFGRILNAPLSYFINNIIEAVVQRRSVKKMFLEISQNSQENAGLKACNSIKKRLQGVFI